MSNLTVAQSLNIETAFTISGCDYAAVGGVEGFASDILKAAAIQEVENHPEYDLFDNDDIETFTGAFVKGASDAQPLETLVLPVSAETKARWINALHGAGIETVGQFEAHTVEKLVEIPYVGRLTCVVIKEAIETPHSYIEELVKLADKLKGFEAYSIPNLIFNFILSHAPRSVKWELETNDPDGEYPHEAYYDLPVLRTSGGNYLNIPLPLLTSEETANFFKQRPVVVERNRHCRDIETPIEFEVENLEKEAMGIMKAIAPHLFE